MVILLCKPVSGYRLPLSSAEDGAMGDSAMYEPCCLLQALHLVPLACLLAALAHQPICKGPAPGGQWKRLVVHLLKPLKGFYY